MKIYAQINEKGQFDTYTYDPVEGWYEITDPPQELLDCSIKYQPDGHGGVERLSYDNYQKLYGPVSLSSEEILGQRYTDLELDLMESNQRMTDLELMMLEGGAF